MFNLEKRPIPEKQQRGLPFMTPYDWYGVYDLGCARCCDNTWLDDKEPIGVCDRCAQDPDIEEWREERRACTSTRRS